MVKTIVLADDHPLFLMGLRSAIENVGEFTIIREASTVDDLYVALASQPPDILITDFSMPGKVHLDGLRLIKKIRGLYPKMPIVVITVLSNPGMITALYKLGVIKVINKNSITTELTKTLMLLGSFNTNKIIQSASHQQSVTQAESNDIQNIEALLSPREYEVLRFFSEGNTVTEIAALLNRSKQTISSQKKNAMLKLGLATDAELFGFIVRTGL